MPALLKKIERGPAVEKCEGCDHVIDGEGAKYCKSYIDPEWKWHLGQCNFATHIKREAQKVAFINPLKAAKMRARGLH